MKRNQLTTNFYLDEYIPKDMYIKYEKNQMLLIGLVDRQLVRADQLLRNQFGVVTINNWWIDGPRQWSGIRDATSPDYSATSQHTFGRASDKIFEAITAEEVRNYIKLNWRKLGITCIEANVNWVHSDVRCYRDELLLIV